MSENVSKIDYSKGLIYKLCCKDPIIENIYIGSTTNFRVRKNKHKSDCNNTSSKGFNYNVYRFIRENGGFENWDMILIENYNCNSKKELDSKEREYVDKLKPSLNTIIPSRTNKEWQEDNKDKINLKKKKFYQRNTNLISQRKKINVICEYCKIVVRKYSLNRHQKTKKCLFIQ